MIPKVKQWAYINKIFITPITKVREEIITLLQCNPERHTEYYLKVLNNTEAVADSLQELIYIKLRNKFPLSYKNCHYNDLQEFMFNNPIELFRLQHLQIKPKSKYINVTELDELEQHNLVEYFNYIVEDGERYSQIYFKLNS